MINKHEKLERWLSNITEKAKDQALRFLLDCDNPRDVQDNAGFIMLQIEEFNRMYPKKE